ncbi:Extracellular calcium-sensing receptor [Acropora cervicornis]|uniref:Extracellular calcium-sensing receptor n=1 Tax=Acropora cervicornis TaxID=6130 RepID=A0AAD9QYK8_ACRCE|nr:Extracellular calcium-sensing receptor [Acropora cervicornis]
MKRKVVAICVFFVLVIKACARNSTNGRLYKQGDVILGGLFPLHLAKENGSCSTLRSNVLMYAEAMVFAIEEINKNGTVLPNITLGYDIRDTCGTDQLGVQIASDFVFKNTLRFDSRFQVANTCHARVTSGKQAPILAIIGGLDSRVSVNVANVVQVVDLPQISYGASSAELAKSEFKSFFRTVPVDSFQSRAITELVSHYKWTCVAVVGVDDLYGRSGVNAFVKAANETSICIAMHQLFPVLESDVIIEQIVTRLKSMHHVQIIVLYSLVPQATKLFDEARRQGLTDKTWIASDGWAESSLIHEARFKSIIQGAFGFGFHASDFDDFKQHVINITPRMNKGQWWDEFWKNDFNCLRANVSSSLLKSCSGSERISSERYDIDFSQGVAPYVRDAVYSVAYGLKALLRNCNEHMQLCSERLQPGDLLSSLETLSFEGLTGHIDFENGEAQAVYDIYNYQEAPDDAFTLVKIGVWNAGKTPKLSLQDDLVEWQNHVKPLSRCGENCKAGTYKSTPNLCSWECIPCDIDTVSDKMDSFGCTRCLPGYISNHDNSKCEEVPIQFINWTDPWGISLGVLTITCLLSVLVVMVITIRHYRTPIIQETGGFLNIALLVFVALSFSFNFLHLSELSDAICRSMPTVFYFIYPGGALTQFIKIYRIRNLVQPPTTPTSKSRHKLVICTSTALCLVPVFLSLIWVLTDPPQFQRYVVSRLEVEAICLPYTATTGLVLRYLCAAYLGVILIADVCIAYRTKNLPHGHKFDEAKHLAFSLTVFLLTFATFYPGWAVLQGPSLTIFACLTNTVAATGTLACNFAPKLWLIFRFSRHNTENYVRPAPFVVRKERSSTQLSIGGVAIALGTGTRLHSPAASSRGSPGVSPVATSKRSSPKAALIGSHKQGKTYL